MKAKASICISQTDTLIESLEISKSRIQIMIDRGMDNEKQLLQGLIDRANTRIALAKFCASANSHQLRPQLQDRIWVTRILELSFDSDTHECNRGA